MFAFAGHGVIAEQYLDVLVLGIVGNSIDDEPLKEVRHLDHEFGARRDLVDVPLILETFSDLLELLP